MATAHLSGSGGLSAVVVGIAGSKATLSGSGSLLPVMRATVRVAAHLSGSGSLSPVVSNPFNPEALLPERSSKTFEKAAAFAFEDKLPVPIRQIMDPAKTPSEWLPFLAAHQSVDLWYPDWSDDLKRAVVANAIPDARLKGTRDGARQFLSYVDGTLLDVVAYPAPFIAGRAIVGRTPVGLKPFVARYLVKVTTIGPSRAFIAGRSAVGRAYVHKPDTDPFDRCLAAIRVAKSPETQIRVDFRHKRQITVNDQIVADGSYRVGDYIDRVSL